MGGKAFSHLPNPPHVIRLPPSTYYTLCEHDSALLRKYFSHVFIPPAAPEKADHGDIDVLIINQLQKGAVVDESAGAQAAGGRVMKREELGLILGARRSVGGGGGSWSFAMPVAATFADDPIVGGGRDGSARETETQNETVTEGETASDEKELCFQLDINPVKPQNWDWECMMRSYGDLWRIVGAVVTRVGLTINNAGLYIRVKEIEERSRAESLLLLTAEPRLMMEFLGLGIREFGDGEGEGLGNRFESLEEVFEWATAWKWFRRGCFEVEEGRRREGEREMYWRFMGEWLPAHPEVGMETDGFVERERVLEMALEVFGVREEYLWMLENHGRKMRKDWLWRTVKETLPLEGKDLGEAMKAMKTFVVWNDGKPVLGDGRERWVEKIPDLDAETVEEVLVPWVRENWKEAVEHARSYRIGTRSVKDSEKGLLKG